jgi:hypothetical protein
MAKSIRAEERANYYLLRDQIEHQEGGIGDAEIRALVAERDTLRTALGIAEGLLADYPGIMDDGELYKWERRLSAYRGGLQKVDGA